jgi:hypothetical protein
MTNKEPIVLQCEGCRNANLVKYTHIEQTECNIYYSPASKWRSGECPMATHLRAQPTTIPAKKKREGQQKHVKQPKLSKMQQKTYSRIGK